MCGGNPCGNEVVKEVLLFPGVGCYLVCCSVSKCGSLFLTGLLLSELVKTKWWHTELWLLNLCGEGSGCCLAVLSAVVGSKYRFSLVEMWYICDALLRGVGILKLSLPLLLFLICDLTVVQSHSRRKLCRLFEWHCWGCVAQDLPSKIVVLWL